MYHPPRRGPSWSTFDNVPENWFKSQLVLTLVQTVPGQLRSECCCAGIKCRNLLRSRVSWNKKHAQMMCKRRATRCRGFDEIPPMPQIEQRSRSWTALQISACWSVLDSAQVHSPNPTMAVPCCAGFQKTKKRGHQDVNSPKVHKLRDICLMCSILYIKKVHRKCSMRPRELDSLSVNVSATSSMLKHLVHSRYIYSQSTS